jgi:Ca2+-binding EF-hand superfamily protein
VVTFEGYSARATAPIEAPHRKFQDSPNKRAVVTQSLLGKSAKKEQ